MLIPLPLPLRQSPGRSLEHKTPALFIVRSYRHGVRRYVQSKTEVINQSIPLQVATPSSPILPQLRATPCVAGMCISCTRGQDLAELCRPSTQPFFLSTPASSLKYLASHLAGVSGLCFHSKRHSPATDRVQRRKTHIFQQATSSFTLCDLHQRGVDFVSYILPSEGTGHLPPLY